MTRTPKTHRIAILALSASLVLPIAPVFGQAQPVVVAPPSPVTAAPPPTILVTPSPIAVTPPPAARPAPVPLARSAAPEPAPVVREARTAPRQARIVRPAPRAPVAAPEPSSAPIAATPAPIAETSPPVATAPPPTPVAATPPPATPAERGSTLPWLIAGLALLAALVGFALWRRRRAREDVYEDYYEEPAVAADAPVLAETQDYQPAIVAPLPSFRRDEPTPLADTGEGIELAPAVPEEATEVATDPADVEALAAGAPTHGDRPWLEMLMRPLRAGCSGDDAVVEFALTVGNTGSVAAEDVRISAWMLASDSSEMERLLIDPPAGATISETRIEAGDGATIEANVSLPCAAMRETGPPVVVADVRYRLPQGGEGRTSASFAIGLPAGEELVPFPANPASGFNEGVEARVHGEVEHV